MITLQNVNAKGETVSRRLNTLLVGLGWDEAQHSLLQKLRGMISGSRGDLPELDLDLSLVVFNEDGDLYDMDPKRSFVYHGNLSLFGAIKHHGNNRTGQGDGCDEYITVTFDLLPEDVGRMTAVINITGSARYNQDFTMAGNAYATLIDFDNTEEIVTLNLNKSSNRGMTGVLAFDIEKKGSLWCCKTIDKSFKKADQAVSMFQHYFNEGLERSLEIAFKQVSSYKS